MKFSIAVILLVCASLTVAKDDFIDAANYLESCFHKIGLNDGHKELTNLENKCGIACLFKAFKLMNEDGSINVSEVQKHSQTLTVEKLNEYVEMCEKEGGYNAQTADYPCEIAACFQKNNYFSDLD